MSSFREAVDYRQKHPIVRPANLDRSKFCEHCLKPLADCELVEGIAEPPKGGQA